MSTLPSSAQLAKLKNVMSLRVRKAHTVYLEKLEAWREARRKVEEQREEVAALDADLRSVVDYMGREDVMREPEKLKLAVSRRHWTIYDREKAQYYLDVAENDLQEASNELDAQKKIWLKLIARENKLDEQRIEAQACELREQEQREELEAEDIVTPDNSPLGRMR